MKSKTWITVALAAGMTLTTSAGVYAGTKLESIRAYVNHGIQIEVNGSAYTAKGSDGEQLAPITYNGSTYLPVRAMADALNVPVNYNATAGKVSLGTSSGSGNSSNGSGTSTGSTSSLKSITYTTAQINQIKQARSGFGVDAFAVPYAPTQIGSQDSFVKVAAADGADSVNLLYKHMRVSAAARDNSGGDFGKGGTRVKLNNGVTGNYYAASGDTGAQVTFEWKGNYFTITALDSSLTKDQLIGVAGSVSKL